MDGAVGLCGERLVVGNDDEGLSELVPQGEEEFVELYLVARVEASGRFVGQHHVGIVDEGAGHGHTLLLTARELGGLVGAAVAEPYEVEELASAVACSLSGSALDESGDEHILLGAEFAQELMLLKYETDVLAAEAGQRVALHGAHILPREHHMSAEKDTGINEVLKALYDISPEGDPVYDEELYTDQDLTFRVCEVIRGEAINRLQDEIPHAVYVEVADIEHRNDGKKLWIRAFLCVERESQKGIVIGKGASKIKEIRTAAVRKLSEIYIQKIDLDLQVKVDKNWRQRDYTLNRLIPSQK